MSQGTDDHTGARIADYRKLRHLTQHGLAQKAFTSRSHLSKVEAGLAPASPELVAAVSRVLRVPPSVLTGRQPYVHCRNDLARMIGPLSTAMDLYDLEPDPHVRPRPLTILRVKADEVCGLACASADYSALGERLPGLLGELTAALYEGADKREAAAGLARVYLAAHIFAYRLGHTDLAAMALERMGWAGDQAQDPLLLAARLHRRTKMLRDKGSAAGALQVLERAQQLVGQADDTTSAPALVVRGTLHAHSAFIAAGKAKREQSSTVEEHIGQAREVAERLGREHPQTPASYWYGFGPVSVNEYAVHASVELEDYGEAIRQFKTIKFSARHPATWVGADHIVIARAYLRTGKAATAVKALERARKVAPQEVRHNPRTRDLVGALVRCQRRPAEGLASLAAWVGIV